jgi:hypothetical protein
MTFTRRMALLPPAVALVWLAGSLPTSRVSRADTAPTPTATPMSTATPAPASTPIPEDSCPHITGLVVAGMSGGSLHPGSAAHLHQLLHVSVEWRLNGPSGSTVQPSSVVIRHRGRAIYQGWLNELYPHAVADVVLDSPRDRGQSTITVQLGTPPCSSSISQVVRVLPGPTAHKPWAFPDCLSTYTAAGAACWLIAGGFRPHEQLSVTYTLRPGSGAGTSKGGLRGQTDGHGIFGPIALDLGPDVTWRSAVLRVAVKGRSGHQTQVVVNLAR